MLIPADFIAKIARMAAQELSLKLLIREQYDRAGH
jgi:hypothetical protein